MVADHAAGGVRFELFLEPRPVPDAVDGLVPGGLDDPGARELGDAGGPPLVHGGRKGFLRRLFGQVEIADQADQGGDDPAPIGAIDCFNGGGGIRWTYLIVNISSAGCRSGGPPFDLLMEAQR